MLFDEKKRASLLKKYEAEGEDRRRLCRLLAVISLSVTAKEIADTMDRTDFKPTGGSRPWKVRDIVPMLDELDRSGLLRTREVWGRTRYALDPLLIGPLWREATLSGEWKILDRAVEDVLKLRTPALLPGRFNDEAECVRALRWTATLEDDEFFFKVWAKMLTSESQSRTLSSDHAIVEAFANPVDERALEALPPLVANLVFSALLFLTLSDAEAYCRSANALFHYVARRGGDCPQPLRLLYAERLILHGRLKEARASLDGVEDASCACLSALLALSEDGDERKALDLMEAGLEELRRRGARRPFFASWAGMFYPILLMKAGASDAKIKGYLTQALEAAKAVVDRGVWKVYSASQPTEDYRQLFQTTDLSANPEVLWYKRYDGNEVGNNVNRYLNQGGGGIGLTASLVDDYLTRDGRPFVGAERLEAKKTFGTELQPTLRDPRLAQTVCTPGQRLRPDQPAYEVPPLLGASYHQNMTGYSLLKHVQIDYTGNLDAEYKASHTVPLRRYPAELR